MIQATSEDTKKAFQAPPKRPLCYITAVINGCILYAQQKARYSGNTYSHASVPPIPACRLLTGR
eukprot:1160071-Pelagomonas_calceolata.AAC.23